MVRNAYKRGYILDHPKISISNERFRFTPPDEMIITTEDINSAIINDLYTTSKNKYYSDIVPFDDSVLDINLETDFAKQLHTDKCTLKVKTNVNIKLTNISKNTVSKLLGVL